MISTYKNWLEENAALWSFCVAFIFFLWLFTYSTPRYCNDDMAMSMAAHGYGMYKYSTCCLINNKALYGFIIKNIPTICGVVGYSTMKVIEIFTICWSAIYLLYKSRCGIVTSICFPIVLTILYISFMVYGVIAGLLIALSIIFANLYSERQEKHYLIIAVLFAFWGFLLRDLMFFLMAICAVPFFPWKTLIKNRQMQTAAGALVALIAFAYVVEAFSYATSEWRFFKGVHNVRISLTDYGLLGVLFNRPDVLQKYCYSTNDIAMINSGMVFDYSIFDYDKIMKIFKECGAKRLINLPNWPESNVFSIGSGLYGAKAFFNPVINFVYGADYKSFYNVFFATAVCACILFRSFKMAISFALCYAAFFFIGMVGRPAHPFIPVSVYFLLFFQAIIIASRNKIGKIFISSVSLLYCAIHIQNVFPEGMCLSKQDIGYYDNGMTYNFEYEHDICMLFHKPWLRNIKIYVQGSNSVAPCLRVISDKREGKGIDKMLQSKRGLKIAGRTHWDYKGMLTAYCKEHLGKELKVIEQLPRGIIRVRCE